MNIFAFKHRHSYKKPPNTKSGLKGVFYVKNPAGLNKPWKAYIRNHGLYELLGHYSAKEEAARAYNTRAKVVYGEGAWLNPVE